MDEKEEKFLLAIFAQNNYIIKKLDMLLYPNAKFEIEKTRELFEQALLQLKELYRED
jgi:hypothetical protein